MSDSSPARTPASDADAAALAAARPAGSVVAATAARAQVLEAHQRCLQSLGAELRQAREARGLSRKALADRLRLGQEQLRALEEGDTAHLPELVFVIAQLRRVAGALQVDLGDRLTPLRSRPSAAISAATRTTATRPAAGASAPNSSFASASFSSRRSLESPARQRDGRRALQLNRAVPLWRWAAGGAVLALALGLALAFGLRWHVDQRAGGATSPPRELAKAKGSPQASRERLPQAGSRATGQGPGGSLRLQAQQPSWLEVRSGRGELLFRGTFSGSRRFRLDDGLRLLAGRPDVVEVSLDHKPSRKLGPISEVVWYTFPPTTPPEGTTLP
jgi:cytoskeleton protein RodZ